MERQVVAKARRPRTEQEQSVARIFGELLQQAVIDARSRRPRDQLDAYYLLLVYASLTGQMEFERKDGEFKELSTGQEARAALEKYVQSNTVRTRPASAELVSRLSEEPNETAEDLNNLSRLAKVSLGRP